MEYTCKLIPISKVLSGKNGIIEPICNSCKSRDCSNPVEIKEVSILGVLKKYRTYMRGDEPYFVVQCNEGYTNDAKNDV
jgi:hypothetical protein